jgi:hypothetical protein
MKNFYYEGQRFKNGNLNIRFSPDEIQDTKAGKYSSIELLSDKLDNFDTYFIGDEYCLSNYTMGSTLYSSYADKVFILDFSDIDNVLMTGDTLKLYSMKPTSEDREIIESEGLWMKNIDSTMKELAQYTRLMEEVSATVDSLKDEIKRYMEEHDTDMISGNEHKATYKAVISNRIDTVALKKDLPDIATRYTKTTETKRFTFQWVEVYGHDSIMYLDFAVLYIKWNTEAK